MRHPMILAAAAATLAGCVCCGDPLKLAEAGKSEYTIIYEFSGDVLLDPAVKDLADTLHEITGAEFPVRKDADGPKIYIGRRAPGDTDEFQSRERRIKSVGKDLYIYGDYRYGTAGAIYNFLYYFCGCRWYTVTGDKRIPKNPDLKFDAIDYRHVPSFKSIEHGGKNWVASGTPEIRDWIRRNNSFLMPNYSFGEPDDAWNYIGPVTHTLFAYMPSLKRKPRSFNDDKMFLAGPHPALADKAYFKEHPEYFTLGKDGKRDPNRQVCFSNPDVRRILLENVEKVIKAEKYDPNQYAVLDFTQNDKSAGFCFCENCQKLVKKYQTPGGPCFDFVAEMGNHFIKKYPKLMIRFFAYQESMTGIPPVGLKFPDNLSVIIAPGGKDFSKPFSHPYNRHYLNQINTWGTLCKEIWLWNYPIMYPHGLLVYSLIPGVFRNSENMKLAYKAGVRYIIAEQGGSVNEGQSFKELNIYLQNRLAEDVDTDVEATVKEFCDAVYGKASADMLKYLKETDRLCNEDPGYFRYFCDPRVLGKLHAPANLIRWQHDFDRMEKLVKDDQQSLFNVRRARINLDGITLFRYRECVAHDATFAKAMPPDKLFERYRERLLADMYRQYRTLPNKKAYRESAAGYIKTARMFLGANRSTPRYPKTLTDKYGKENLTTLYAYQARIAPTTWDRTAVGGFAVRIPIPRASTAVMVQHIYMSEKNGLPWYNVDLVRLRKSFLTAKDLETIRKGKGYQLVRIGRSKVTVGGVLQLATLPARHTRFFLGKCFDPKNPDQEFDFYLSVRDGGDGKSLLVDRLVLAKAKGGKGAATAKK